MSTDDRTDDTSVPLLDELLQVVPRLVDRTRSQAAFARSVAGLLPCVGPIVARHHDEPGPGVPEHERVDILSVLGDGQDDEPAAPAVVDEPPPSEPVAAPPAESELPIQDYDSLAASQVVPRLSTLGPDELRAVHAYEAATRHRQTILNRVAQLLSS